MLNILIGAAIGVFVMSCFSVGAVIATNKEHDIQPIVLAGPVSWLYVLCLWTVSKILAYYYHKKYLKIELWSKYFGWLGNKYVKRNLISKFRTSGEWFIKIKDQPSKKYVLVKSDIITKKDFKEEFLKDFLK